MQLFAANCGAVSVYLSDHGRILPPVVVSKTLRRTTWTVGKSRRTRAPAGCHGGKGGGYACHANGKLPRNPLSFTWGRHRCREPSRRYGNRPSASMRCLGTGVSTIHLQL